MRLRYDMSEKRQTHEESMPSETSHYRDAKSFLIDSFVTAKKLIMNTTIVRKNCQHNLDFRAILARMFSPSFVFGTILIGCFWIISIDPSLIFRNNAYLDVLMDIISSRNWTYLVILLQNSLISRKLYTFLCCLKLPREPPTRFRS